MVLVIIQFDEVDSPSTNPCEPDSFDPIACANCVGQGSCGTPVCPGSGYTEGDTPVRNADLAHKSVEIGGPAPSKADPINFGPYQTFDVDGC
jgi:hypothetical protein